MTLVIALKLLSLAAVAASAPGGSLSDPPAAASPIVAARSLPAGAVIGEADLQIDATDPNSSERAREMIGKEARRMLAEGAPIRETDLRTATLVRRNALVRMRYMKGPLSITAEGRALSGGGKGDMINVMNLSSKTVVSAEIIADGTVVVR
ncbi:MAG: flagellar basal body P-ring formation protein FlgA [Parvularculaceae bacterium]|nr:flagellar basal body P-ring formation protein FlgA [Parvularculaceae bacterium]